MTDSAAVASAATSKDEAMAVMEEEDLDAVADAWGADEELISGAPTEGLDEEMEGFENGGEAQGDEDEEGGWDMEVRLAVHAMCINQNQYLYPDCSICFQRPATKRRKYKSAAIVGLLSIPAGWTLPAIDLGVFACRLLYVTLAHKCICLGELAQAAT